jgi:hypothetical protein
VQRRVEDVLDYETLKYSGQNNYHGYTTTDGRSCVATLGTGRIEDRFHYPGTTDVEIDKFLMSARR